MKNSNTYFKIDLDAINRQVSSAIKTLLVSFVKQPDSVVPME
jgi:hypothetical protein